MHFNWTYINTVFAAWAPRMGAAILVVIGCWLATALIIPLVKRVLGRRLGEHSDLVDLSGRVARVALWVFGLVSALGTLGIDVSALVAGLGLTGFALGFALKDALSNVLAGVMILFYRPFKRGSQIIVSGYEGTVEQIDLRYTTLIADGKRFLIPNQSLITNAITILQPKASPNSVTGTV